MWNQGNERNSSSVLIHVVHLEIILVFYFNIFGLKNYSVIVHSGFVEISSLYLVRRRISMVNNLSLVFPFPSDIFWIQL